MEPRERRFSIWYVLFAFAALTILQSVFSAPHAETIAEVHG